MLRPRLGAVFLDTVEAAVICVMQHRAAIGCWHAAMCRKSVFRCPLIASSDSYNLVNVLYLLLNLSLAVRPLLYLCILLLLVSGDVHPNPGPSPPDGIRMCHLNARSLLKPGRLDEIYLELCSLHCFDIIAVSESHLCNTIPDTDIAIPNYNVFRRDRNRQGGGVLLYIHSRFTCIRRTDLECPTLELLWAEIKLRNHSLLVGVSYRPPNQTAQEIELFIEGLYDSLDSITGSLNQSIVLLGDFNDRCVNWDSDHRDSEVGLKLVNLVASMNLFQLVTTPTRNNNLLDLLITDSPGYFMDIDTLDPIDDLDHRVIYGTFNIVTPKSHNIKRKVWLYDRANYERLNNLFLSTDWDDLFSSSPDIDVITDNFTSLILYYAEECIPNKLITIRSRDKPGVTAEVRRLLRVAKRLHSKAKRSQNPVHWEHFRNARREAKSAFRTARSKFYSDIADKLLDSETNSKTYWKLSKLVYGNKVSKNVPDLLKNDTPVSDSAEKASLFNTFFSEQCRLPPGSDADPLPDFQLLTDSVLDHINSTPAEVKKILKSLNIAKAVGPDGISNRILRECADSLCVPLARLFNLSLQTGTFPSSWKLANVVPVFKKNDRKQVENYRPVSLLSTLSKVFERVVHTRLYDFCTANNLLTDKNSGFKKQDSTVNQLVDITTKINDALDQKEDACLVFLDISKAFDRVWHKGLLFKLRQFGINGMLLQWFSSYLSNRKQQVQVDGETSAALSISAGVPQGSILGPLLFLIYINDLVVRLECDPHLFADDTFLLDFFKNPLVSAARINRDLQRIKEWGLIWKVFFNPVKTMYMIASKKFTPINYPDPVFNGTTIMRVDSHKHLGLHFTQNFTWGYHIECTLVKASKTLRLVNQAKNLLPRRALCSLYTNMVLPIVEYCDVIYDNCTIRDSLQLEKFQRRAALICTGAYRHTSTDSLLADLGWQPLRIRREIHKLSLFYKIYNSLTPFYLRRLVPRQPVNDYRLRSTSNSLLPIPFSRLSSTRNGFVHSTVKLWNSLPLDVRSVNSLNTFKLKVKSHLYRQLNPKFIPRLYSYTPLSKASVYHCRLRLGLSALNFHRFTYNFIDFKSCPKCDFTREDITHFIFHCAAYAVPRAALFRDLSTLLPDNVLTNPSLLQSYLIYGSNELEVQTNLSIFSLLHDYLIATGRFS